MLATRARFCIAALSAFLLLSGCETRQSDILAPARELDLLDAVRRVEISYDTAYTPTADTAQLHSITQNLKLRATAFDSSGSAIYGLSYRWTSSRTSFYIAPDTFSLDTDTTSVTALANGLALVRVIVGDHRDSVWVRERQVADTFSVQPDTALMNPATTLQLAVTARDSLSQPVRLVFSSTDTSVATTDTMGLISAVAPGAAKIIVTAAGIRRVVPITVRTGPLVQSIVVQPAVDTLNALLLTKQSRSTRPVTRPACTSTGRFPIARERASIPQE